MYSKFEEELPILDGPGNLRLGICAMGPVAATDTITSMQVWAWQVTGDKVAVSSGVAGTHPGDHALVATEKLPYTADKGWMVQTKLEPGSSQFVEGKPARVMALAQVTNADGTEKDVLEWHQAVLVKGHRNHKY
jgi:hypothetical protein